jgi:hypothetical protein
MHVTVDMVSTYKQKYASLTFVGLFYSISRSPVPSFSCKWHYFILLCGWTIFHCVYISHFLYPVFGWGHQGWVYSLALVNRAAVNMEVHGHAGVSLVCSVTLLWVLPKSTTARPQGRSSCSFLMILHTDFHSGSLSLTLNISQFKRPSCNYRPETLKLLQENSGITIIFWLGLQFPRK